MQPVPPRFVAIDDRKLTLQVARVSRLACIIPVVGSIDGLEATLISVLERLPSGCEVIVVLDTPYQDPYGLESELRFLEAPSGAGFVSCVNLGIAAAQAEFIHVLAAGSEVTDGWIEAALQHFADPSVGSVVPALQLAHQADSASIVGIEYRAGGDRVACPVNLRSSLLGPTGGASFYRMAALQSVGGFEAAVGDQLADVDVALSLLAAGWQSVVAADCRIVASQAVDKHTTGFKSALQSERLFWRHFGGRAKLIQLVSHLILILQDCLAAPIWKAPARILGRFIACCQLGHYRQYRQRIAAARSAATSFLAARTAETKTESSARDESPRRHRIDEPHVHKSTKQRHERAKRRA